jgi:phosphohistidine swiveling domain-containing protein
MSGVGEGPGVGVNVMVGIGVDVPVIVGGTFLVGDGWMITVDG